jgi:hypothetical protein
MKKSVVIFIVVLVSFLIITTLVLSEMEINPKTSGEEPRAFVGVTYCGNSVIEAKLLVDKVKDYTNLFVLQSPTLQRDFKSVDEVGDYAVSKGLYFLPYFGAYIEPIFSNWLENAKQRWGNHFLGVYYADEVGGKMLDGYVEIENNNGEKITKTTYGDTVLEMSNGVVIQYEINFGVIHLSEPSPDSGSLPLYSTFYPNGTIEGQRSDRSIFHSYEDLYRLKPFKSYDDVAQMFVSNNNQRLLPIKNQSKIFTSDYALYWWDYQSGYDVLLAQIGWNISENQQISLVRGAADMMNKDWGAVITWKYNQPPYLDTGTQVFEQMRVAYECGAKYLVLFNYYDNSSSYGTIRQEHFQAIKDFWDNVFNNHQVLRGSVKPDTVLVLPKNYGWGMRWQTDHIWGVFNSDNISQQIWDQLQLALQNHELRTDIVYNDIGHNLTDYYKNVNFWNK